MAKVVFGQSGGIQAKELVFGKLVVYGQSGCLRTKWLYLGNNGCIR